MLRPDLLELRENGWLSCKTIHNLLLNLDTSSSRAGTGHSCRLLPCLRYIFVSSCKTDIRWHSHTSHWQASLRSVSSIAPGGNCGHKVYQLWESVSLQESRPETHYMISVDIGHECALLAVEVNSIQGKTSSGSNQNNGAHERNSSARVKQWSVLAWITRDRLSVC
jgi:hypothetical protein